MAEINILKQRVNVKQTFTVFWTTDEYSDHLLKMQSQAAWNTAYWATFYPFSLFWENKT
jgi:hypothetical protein